MKTQSVVASSMRWEWVQGVRDLREHFWGPSDVLYPIRGLHYTSIYIRQNQKWWTEYLYILLYV